MNTIKGIIFIGALSAVASSYSVDQEKIKSLRKQISDLRSEYYNAMVKSEQKILQSWDASIHEQLIGNGFNTEHTPVLTVTDNKSIIFTSKSYDNVISSYEAMFNETMQGKDYKSRLESLKNDLAHCKDELNQSLIQTKWNSCKTSLCNISKRQWLIGAGVTITAGIAAYITYKYMNREKEKPKKKKEI